MLISRDTQICCWYTHSEVSWIFAVTFCMEASWCKRSLCSIVMFFQPYSDCSVVEDSTDQLITKKVTATVHAAMGDYSTDENFNKFRLELLSFLNVCAGKEAIFCRTLLPLEAIIFHSFVYLSVRWSSSPSVHPSIFLQCVASSSVCVCVY